MEGGYIGKERDVSQNYGRFFGKERCGRIWVLRLETGSQNGFFQGYRVMR